MAWFTDKYYGTPADAKDRRLGVVNADLSGLETYAGVTHEFLGMSRAVSKANEAMD